jgi:predicted secreted hydrolase
VLWELELEGRGRLFERAEHVTTDRERYREVDVEGRLRFTAWGDPLSFRSGLAVGVASSHYEQPGSMSGTVLVGERRAALSGRGLRDHSWGVRDWQEVPYWRWFGVVLDPDVYVLLNNVGRPDGSETAGGFLSREGVVAPIASCETESELDPDLRCQRSFRARATDELGRETTLEGRALEVAPLRQRRSGRTTYVNEALTEYRWEGHVATGISEYLVQEADPGDADGAGRR